MLFSCNQSSVHSDNAKSASDVPANDGSQKSIIGENTDNTANILASREWDLPPDVQSGWEQAKEISNFDTIHFDNIKASVIVKFTSISKDTSNFILKSATVNVLEHHKNYNLTASISDQVNMGTKQAFNTYVTVSIQATLKPGKLSTRKLEGKMFALYAKKGTIEPL